MNIKRLIAILCCVLYAITVIIVLPICIYERNRHYSSKVEAWFIGGIFVLATLPVSMLGIMQHALNYSKPHLQKYIIRILFMVPIYALNSWIVLKFPEASIYLDTVRECYEAFVIYNFMMYLISFLKHEIENFELVSTSKENIHLLPPLCCCPTCSNGMKVLDKCKFGVLQYTLIRIVTSFIAYVTEIFKVYNEGRIDFRYAWTYLAMANNFSQMIAMFCLILFYTVFRKELEPLNPIRQYLCIKFVVFATFWQSILIAVLVRLNLISVNQWPYFPTLVDTVNGLQDFLICIEMFIASIAHILAFPITPYKMDQTQSWWWNIANAANVSDFNTEVQIHANHFYGKLKTAVSRKSDSNLSNSEQNARRSDSGPTEDTRLLVDHEELNSGSSNDGPLLTEQILTINNDDDDAILI